MTLKHFLIVGALLLPLTACQHLPHHKAATITNKTATLTSSYNYQQTIDRLKNAISSKGMTVFSVIDHETAAKNVGLTMQPATVIVYGNPKAGTPLMVKDPNFALTLPLKVLVTQVDGQVKVIYTPSDVLVQGSQIKAEDVANTLANAEKLIQATIK